MPEHVTHADAEQLPPPSAPIGWIVVVLVLLAAAGAVALALMRHHAESSEADRREKIVAAGPVVRVVKVETGTPERLAALPGEVHAFTQATLFAKVSGYVKSINADKGDRVKKNQVLATLEAPDIEDQITAAEADLAVKLTVEKRDAALVQPRVISQTEMDQAAAAVKVARAALERLKAQRDYAVIRAPFDGVITARYVDPGALVPAATGSTQAALPVVDIADLDRLRIYVYLSQQDAPYVRVGDPVEIVLDGVPRPPIKAQISRLSDALDPRTRTMLCEIDLTRQQGVFPGSFVHVRMKLSSEPTPIVPVEALVTENGRLSVGVVNDGHVHFEPITTGIDDGKRVQVLSGLRGGELVAINLSSAVAEGAQVQVQQTPAQPERR